MSLNQFETSLSSWSGQTRPGVASFDSSGYPSLGSGIANHVTAADYYSTQAAYAANSAAYAAVANSGPNSSTYSGYLSQNGEHHHSHNHSHHSSSHHTHHSGINAYSSLNSESSHHTGSVSSVVQSSSSYPTQYRDYSPSVPSSHPDNGMVSSLPDCAVMTSLPGSTPGSLTTTTVSPTSVSPQYTYLEPSNLLPRRNGGVTLSPYGTDSMTASFSDISQINGSPYHHLNPHHLASQLHHSHHHGHHHHLHHARSGLSGQGPVVAPVIHKWMQVKRNVPKPGKFPSLTPSHKESLAVSLLFLPCKLYDCLNLLAEQMCALRVTVSLEVLLSLLLSS